MRERLSFAESCVHAHLPLFIINMAVDDASSYSLVQEGKRKLYFQIIEILNEEKIKILAHYICTITKKGTHRCFCKKNTILPFVVASLLFQTIVNGLFFSSFFTCIVFSLIGLSWSGTTRTLLSLPWQPPIFPLPMMLQGSGGQVKRGGESLIHWSDEVFSTYSGSRNQQLQ